jgi:Rieske Fe-S protein
MDGRDGPVPANRLTRNGQRSANGLPRRTFLDVVLGVGFVSSALAMVYPIVRYLIPPRTAEPATASVVVTKLSEIAPNTGRVFRFGDRPALLVRTPDGDLRAFDAVCTHLECTVQYRADISQIWCACHNGMFDLGGNVVSGPPPRPLTPLIVNLRGEAGAEEIVVSKG